MQAHELFTVPQMAERLSVGRKTVKDVIDRSGQIRPAKMRGTMPLYDRTALEAVAFELKRRKA